MRRDLTVKPEDLAHWVDEAKRRPPASGSEEQGECWCHDVRWEGRGGADGGWRIWHFRRGG